MNGALPQYEDLELLAVINPASYNSAQATAWIDVGKYAGVFALIQTGLIAATGTFDAEIRQAQNSGGTGAKDIGAGKAITPQIDTNDNRNFWINVRNQELDADNGFEHVRLELTPAVAATLASAMLFGYGARYKPVATTNFNQIVP
jgi:cell wall assembly regulator SMI1